MKYFRDLIVFVMVLLIPITGIICVTFLMYNNINGWGWLLFTTIILWGSVSIKLKD